jgi:hypothetical protein
VVVVGECRVLPFLTTIGGGGTHPTCHKLDPIDRKLLSILQLRLYYSCTYSTAVHAVGIPRLKKD